MKINLQASKGRVISVIYAATRAIKEPEIRKYHLDDKISKISQLSACNKLININSIVYIRPIELAKGTTVIESAFSAVNQKQQRL